MKKRSLVCLSILFSLLAVSCNSNENKAEEQVQAQMPSNSIATTSSEAAVPDSIINKLQLCAALAPDTVVNGDTIKQAGGLKFLKWPEETRELKVKFLDGDPFVQQKVQQIAKQWEEYCGMTLNFGNWRKADITITFRQNGSWSYIGKSSSSYIPSMNFGWFSRNTSDEEFHRTTLHEFGHALGLIHEHQNPNNNPIRWNKPVVYAYFMRPPNNWSKEQVDFNLFEAYDHDQINGTRFDPNSIMLYGFPRELTLDGYSTRSNSQLSELDKQLIQRTYPN